MRLFDRICAGTLFLDSHRGLPACAQNLHGQNLDPWNRPSPIVHRHVKYAPHSQCPHSARFVAVLHHCQCNHARIRDRADAEYRKIAHAAQSANTAAGNFVADRNLLLNREELLISIQDSPGGATFAVKVHPRARRNAITGELDGALKLSLTAPPLDGKANEACIEFFANLLKVPRSSVTIASGQSSRNKVIRVAGLTAEKIRKRIA